MDPSIFDLSDMNQLDQFIEHCRKEKEEANVLFSKIADSVAKCENNANEICIDIDTFQMPVPLPLEDYDLEDLLNKISPDKLKSRKYYSTPDTVMLSVDIPSFSDGEDLESDIDFSKTIVDFDGNSPSFGVLPSSPQKLHVLNDFKIRSNETPSTSGAHRSSHESVKGTKPNTTTSRMVTSITRKQSTHDANRTLIEIGSEDDDDIEIMDTSINEKTLKEVNEPKLLDWSKSMFHDLNDTPPDFQNWLLE